MIHNDSLAYPDQFTRQPLIDVPIISVGCNTTGAYNRNIDKRLARKLVWLRETTTMNAKYFHIGFHDKWGYELGYLLILASIVRGAY